MDRVSYIGIRAIQVVPILLGISVLVFMLIHLIPGDPARTLLGPRAPEAAVQALDQKWGLDQPLLVQFGRFLGGILHGDLGDSLTYQESATALMAERIEPTLWLLVASALLTVLITVPVATLAAARPDRLADHAVRLVPLLGLGMPTFWVAIMLILLLALTTHVFPVGGFGRDFVGHLRSIFLPALTIAIAISPITIRSLRASMLEVLGSDYVVSARAKGLTERRVLVAHVLRNAMIPTVTVLGLNIGWLVGNTLIVEKVFALPGIGALMIDSILSRDFPVVQAIALVFAILVVLVSTTTDLARSLLDPRVRLR